MRTPQISSRVITTQCRLYSNISQILLLYNTWRYYNKFDYTNALGYVTYVSKYRHAGKWSMDIAFYVQKAYNTWHSCHNFPVGSRQAARGARICETSLLFRARFSSLHVMNIMNHMSHNLVSSIRKMYLSNWGTLYCICKIMYGIFQVLLHWGQFECIFCDNYKFIMP